MPRSPLATGVLLAGSQPAGEMAQLAELAEELGYDFLWYADEKFFRDPFVSLAVAAQHTQRLKLGIGVTEPYARHPALTAMAMATLDEAAGGRAVLGISAGGSGFPPMGIRRARPTVALAEAIELMRRLWRGETVTVQGDVVSFTNGRLSFAPLRPRIPVYIAARGRRMLRLAGQIGDGAIIAPFASPPGLRYTVDLIEAGAHEAGRSLDELDLVGRVDVCIAEDRPTAAQTVKRWIALPLWSSYPNWDYLDPLPIPRVPAEIRAVLATRDYTRIDEAALGIPDSFVEHLAVAGTLDDVARQTLAIAQSGVTQVTIHPVQAPGQGVADVLRSFAREVMPAVRTALAEAR